MPAALILLAALVVGTWNGNWFPSGRAEHRANPAVEAATIKAAAEMLASGIQSLDPAGTNDIILCLNEIRGPKVASNLVAQIGRKDLKLAIISAYRRRDRFDMQQDMIATTLPVAKAHWSRWRQAGAVTPPRGYAFAAVVVTPAVTAEVYAVHLKSNYGATTPAIRTSNRDKRTVSATQLVKEIGEKDNRLILIAGDMNADCWRQEFAEEQLFAIFESAGMKNLLAALPPAERGTHPSKRYGDSALDYLFVRGMEPLAKVAIVPNDELSDHRAVFALVTESAAQATPATRKEKRK